MAHHMHTMRTLSKWKGKDELTLKTEAYLGEETLETIIHSQIES